MSDFLAALALALVMEGLLYAAFPEQMKRMLATLMALPASHLRTGALAYALVGLVLLWIVRG
ncbi:hypothetical protein VE25_04135 [Devosia geojensis]|uniref:Ubiquitin-binding protein n=1 Tax=Devosia geojensis TaxID=443610 RepID=A0A0F5FW09_9HYPH|nr:DUF2065 domain-containing protein [Devosia geojensis]KKB13029.1 hypothetical protein VE25_04135 [Devosia geojensis]